MNKRLQEERLKAQELLKNSNHLAPSSKSFNLSDLKTDKTQYFESPTNQKFEPSEISARSTALNRKQILNETFTDMDFDEIMRTSASSVVRDKYRQSMGRLSFMPRTADMSLRTSISSNTRNTGMDFWDQAEVSMQSFDGKNVTAQDESFKPAEEMEEKMQEDDMEQQKEFALDMSQLQKYIKNYDTPEMKNMVLNFGKSINELSNDVQEEAKANPKVRHLSRILNGVDFTGMFGQSRNKDDKEKENDNLDVVPVKEAPSISDDNLQRSENAITNRGLKRRSRSSSVSNETPKTTLDKCFRSKSPTMQNELQAAAATMLKPKPDEDHFKVPQSLNSIRSNISSFNKTGNKSKPVFDETSSSREYVTAPSLHLSGEKLSLPNYGLIQPENVFTSPARSLRTSGNSSPFSSHGELKRTSSQLSNGSEFHDDVLPIKIQKSSRKLSWSSVKLNHSSSNSISIQNGSNKKLSLRVKVQGNGFSVTPSDDFRMIPNEARTFEVKFHPINVGPSRGQLIFELISNSKCMKSIPLYAYGGHCAMKIDGIQKPPEGKSFITMGDVRMLKSKMVQQIRLTNTGTIPGFAVFVFETKRNWSGFNASRSLFTSPTEVRVAPGETKVVNIEFKATKEEIRKIMSLNTEVPIIGEVCMISSDEPTRLRIFHNKEFVPEQFLNILPVKLPYETEIKRDLLLFNEYFDRQKISVLLDSIRFIEISLTVNRNMDDTQVCVAELSMADDADMSFETFCETNRTIVNSVDDVNMHQDEEYGCFESKFFRVSPAQVTFSLTYDQPNVPKLITIESTCANPLYAEAVSTKSHYITAIKACGSIEPGESVEIKVLPKSNAFIKQIYDPIFVSILIDNAKIDVPVRFIE
ncbi:CLUMA_CG004070, isoform A [Clunio marinus]|uniref:CLUMA_CG004070, isoform A n=1 Tax=Clunio marinus TaxID=568069 RepID=A0A1J1HQS8_9DIPT|nr:CLUMA_CG004070, isoform A [Clunio marinus]